VKNLLLAYRVMASIVGVLLIVLVLVGVPLNHLHDLNASWFPEGGDAQEAGDWISGTLGVAHGWLYMIFVFTAFILSRRAKWDIKFTLVTLICGTVPILSFWSEHRATAKVRSEFAAEL